MRQFQCMYFVEVNYYKNHIQKNYGVHAAGA